MLEPALEVEAMKLLREAFSGASLTHRPERGVDGRGRASRWVRGLTGTLEYLEDPTPGLTGHGGGWARGGLRLPLADQTWSWTKFQRLARSRCQEFGSASSCPTITTGAGCVPVQHLADRLRDVGVWGWSMHSNSHLGISLAAMTHLALSVAQPHLRLRHALSVAGGGRFSRGEGLRFEGGGVERSSRAGPWGSASTKTRLKKLHQQYLRCGFEDRDDKGEMRKYEPDWAGALPRF